MRISDLNWMQVEAYLRHDDRAVLPLGSTEQHSYLRLARSPAREVFGSERLQAALRAHNGSAANLVRGVITALEGFTGHAAPHDDVTLLVARSVG